MYPIYNKILSFILLYISTGLQSVKFIFILNILALRILFNLAREFYVFTKTQQYKENANKLASMHKVAEVDWLLRFVPLLESRNYALFNFKLLFTGQMTLLSQCDRCLYSSISVDVFKLLPVPLPTDASIHIEELLSKVTSLERTTTCNSCCNSFQPLHSSSPKPGSSAPGLDQMVSPIAKPSSKSNRTTASTRHSTFINILPPYFVVQLLRFKVDKPSTFSFATSNNAQKLFTNVQLGTSPIDLYSILNTPVSKNHFYQLYAVILHYSCQAGSTERGMCVYISIVVKSCFLYYHNRSLQHNSKSVRGQLVFL